MPEPTTTLLVTITGHDKPGVTSRLFSVLADFPVEVLDVEQVVVRARLILGVLVTAPDDATALEAALRDVAVQLDVTVDVSPGGSDPQSQRSGRSHVTVLGHPLKPDAMAAAAGQIANAGGNIDRILRLASYPVTCIEMEVSGADPARLRSALASEALHHGFDVAVQPSGLMRRAKRLIVMDVDSTLVQGEAIDLLADKAGVAEQVTKITGAAMRGELDFAEALRARVELLAGLAVSALYEVRDELTLTRGARTLVRTLKRLDYRFAIVSGGFTQLTDSIAEELGIHYSAANTLEIIDGRLTGRITGPVLDQAGKAAALIRFAEAAGVPLSQTVAVGDGANDLDMIAAAGLGVAFNAKPIIQDAADTALNVPHLDAVLYLLGISRDEVEAADAADWS